MRRLAPEEMHWMNEPPRVAKGPGGITVETAPETDFWRTTGYGFVHDDGHFLGAPLGSAAAIEVTFSADFEAQFDQAGLMLRADAETWLKAGVERSDGRLWASVVVTNGRSDWSVAPLPERSADDELTFRASRQGDAVTVRYRETADERWRLLRLAYLPPEAKLLAGPMCCSPTRGGLSVRFGPVRMGPPDDRLHEEG